MSDPVSNADIEDVLSSIRRLVSEEPSGQDNRARPAPEAEVERFVLTPAFRIAEADPASDELSETESSDAESDQPQDAGVDVAAGQAEDVIARDHPAAVEPVETVEAAVEPGETIEAAAEPVETVEVAAEPVETVEVAAEPVDTVEAAAEPVETIEAAAEPVETIEAAAEPVETVEAAAEPVETVAAAAEHVDAAEAVLEAPADPEPANSPDSVMPETQPAPPPEPQISEEFESGAEWTDPGAKPAMSVEDIQPPAAEDPQTAPEDLTLEERIAELEVAIQQDPQEWEPDGSEDGDSDETRPLSADAGPNPADLTEALTAAQPAAEPEQDAAPQSEPQTDAAPELSEEDFSDVPVWVDGAADVPAPPDDALADTSPVIDSSEAVPEPAALFAHVAVAAPSTEEPQVQDTPEEPAVEWQDVRAEPAVDAPAPEETPIPDAAEALRAWDASPMQETADPEPDEAPEALVDGETQDDPAPEEARAAPVESETQDDPVHQAEAEAEAAAPQTGDGDGASASDDSDADEPPGNFLADEEATLDEEALREMVSDMVRHELQGVLGERITRNVRRLVRREIQRALAMRDLE